MSSKERSDKKNRPAGYALFPMLETERGKDGIPEAKVSVAASPGTFQVAGDLLMCWGQFQIALTAYTNCLVAYNKTEGFQEKAPPFRRVWERFKDETEIALSDTPRIRTIVRKMKPKANAAKIVRDHVGHSQLFAVMYENEPSGIGAIFRTKKGEQKTVKYRFGRLCETREDICLFHGRVLQLALSTKHPIHDTQQERQRLQEIVDTGYWNFPNLPKL